VQAEAIAVYVCWGKKQLQEQILPDLNNASRISSRFGMEPTSLICSLRECLDCLSVIQFK
jgi:hypothetical protein